MARSPPNARNTSFSGRVVAAMRTQPEHGLSGWRPTRTGMTGPGVQAGLLQKFSAAAPAKTRATNVFRLLLKEELFPEYQLQQGCVSTDQLQKFRIPGPCPVGGALKVRPLWLRQSPLADYLSS